MLDQQLLLAKHLDDGAQDGDGEATSAQERAKAQERGLWRTEAAKEAAVAMVTAVTAVVTAEREGASEQE
eukprot:SM005850S18619  [mRNA]  locus=s5850:536:943:+ [translate_table: standard]